MVTKAKKALLASLTAFLCVMLTVFGLSMSASTAKIARAADGVAQIGATTYSTLKAAVDAAKEGDTITLLSDTTVANIGISKSLTIDLGGKTVSTNSGAKAFTISNGDVTIKNGTIKSGAVVNGGNRGDSNYTIYVTTTSTSDEVSLTIENAKVYGNENQKSGVTSETRDTITGLYKYYTFAGTAIYASPKESDGIIYGTIKSLTIEDSFIYGGNGTATNGTQAMYVSGGANFASGGVAIYANASGATLTIDNSEVYGGNSDLYNAADALNLQKGAVIITNSTIEGGSAFGSGSHGIAGAAVFTTGSVSEIGISGSTLKGGSSNASFNGSGIEMSATGSKFPTTTIENSSIIGGQGTGGTQKDPQGYAIDSGNFSSIENVTFKGSNTLTANQNTTVIRGNTSDVGFTLANGANLEITSGKLDNVTIVAQGNGGSVTATGENASIGTISTTDESSLITINNNGETTTIGTEKTVEAQIGETTYETLEAAIEAANTGDTIVLLKNVVVTDLVLTKGVTIKSEGETQYEIKGLKEIAGTGVTLYNVYINLDHALEIGGTNTTLTNCIIRAKDLTYDDVWDGDYYKQFLLNDTYSYLTRISGTNVTLTNCRFDGRPSAESSFTYFGNMCLAPVTGTDVKMIGCTFYEAHAACYYSTPKGTWTIDGCTFERIYEWQIHAGDSNATIIVKNTNISGWCALGEGYGVTFDGCTFSKRADYNASQYGFNTSSDVVINNSTFDSNFVNNGTSGVNAKGNSVVEISGCKFTSGNAISDLVSAESDTSVIAIDAEKDADGKYVGGTFVGTPEAIANVISDKYEAVANGDGTYAVREVKGTKDNPYTLAELNAMTRAEYIAAQEKLGGTMYVTVGTYVYSTNGVLGNGERNDTTGQIPDHSKLNAYGENGYLGEKNDGANGKNIVFVNGAITSGVTGYASIDNIGTSLLLAVPAYTNVTFSGITFNNVMSFDYQLYTSPWSQLGELKFDECTFNGIIVGAIATQTLTFNKCTFTNYTT